MILTHSDIQVILPSQELVNLTKFHNDLIKTVVLLIDNMFLGQPHFFSISKYNPLQNIGAFNSNK